MMPSTSNPGRQRATERNLNMGLDNFPLQENNRSKVYLKVFSLPSL